MVEWKKLVSVSDLLYGYPFESSLFSEDSNYMPLIRIRDVKPAKASTYYTGEILDSYRIKKGDILVGMDGEFNLGKWNDRDGLLNQRVLKLKGKRGYSLDGYLFHYMGPVFKKIEKETAGGSVKHLSAKVINNIQIPIPSISEQQQIVDILDTFTASIENLKQQIAERRKQYEHYRDQLLDFEGKEGVEMKTLGEIGKCVAGATPSTKENSYWDNGNIPWMSSGEIHQGIVRQTASFITQKGYDNASTKMLPIDTVVIALAGQGKTRGTVAITAIELCTNQSLCGVVIKDANIINKYVYYYLKTRYDDLRRISSGEGTRGGLNMKMIGSYNVPIPSLQEQSRIVSILDTFEASIANLEAQLKLREKQYEYYRNKLLTFE